MKRMLMVGQTPPPYGGQAIMISKLVNANYKDLEIIHLRMSFSQEMDEIGHGGFIKLWKLVLLIIRTLRIKVKQKPDILYYPPAGPDLVPILRDTLFLLVVRPFFKHTVFHFHAGGLSTKLSKIPFILRKVILLAYRHPTLAIKLSSLNPPDGEYIGAKYSKVIPYGIDDQVGQYLRRNDRSPIEILFVGVLKRTKGVLDLIDAAKILQERGGNFKINFMGKFESTEFKSQVEERVEEYDLNSKINFIGVKVGKDKFDWFEKADIFCFPTFFESETFGVVLLEAMQYSLPIVTTNWRGVPDVVKNDYNGFIVEPGDIQDLSNRLSDYCNNHTLRITMGEKSRKRYEDNFISYRFIENFERAILDVVS